jgi:hypothetical protein
MKTLSVIFLSSILLFTSCAVNVKPYQKNMLNDKDMELNNQSIEASEINFQVYREGAAGANGGKSGGGCGCN